MSTFICDIEDVMHLLSHRLIKVSTSNFNHFYKVCDNYVIIIF